MKRLAALMLLLLSPAAAIGQTHLSETHDRPEAGALDGAGPGGQSAGGRGPAAPALEGLPEEGGPPVGGVTLGAVDYSTLSQPGRISADTATIQRAWDKATGAAGVAGYRDCGDCVYRVRTRELMVTTIVLPEDRAIDHVDIGDPVGFDIQTRAGNIIAVRPRTIGIDSNMNVYTDRGVMSFYLRAEGFDSDHVPDLVVRIDRPEPLAVTGPLSWPAPGTDTRSPGPGAARQSTIHSEGAPGRLGGPAPGTVRPQAGDTTSGAGFDPAKLRGWGDYNLRGDDALRPETVFRDDHFTYVHFGDRWTDLELPVAFVVIDGIDETVNTRVRGRMLVVESTAPLISLKSGEKHLCIEYRGDRT